jgi:hypothetical protein
MPFLNNKKSVPTAIVEYEIQDFVLVAYNGQREHVTLPDELVSIGDGAFKGCKELKSIKLPTNLERIGHYAFADCKNLTSVDFPNNLRYIGDFAFKNCSQLPVLRLPENVSHIGRNCCSCAIEVQHNV